MVRGREVRGNREVGKGGGGMLSSSVQVTSTIAVFRSRPLRSRASPPPIKPATQEEGLNSLVAWGGGGGKGVKNRRSTVANRRQK